MNKLYRHLYLTILLTGAILLVSCGRKETSDQSQAGSQPTSPKVTTSPETDKPKTEAAEASFETGKGLLLLEDTKKNLGLEFSPVREQRLAPTVSLTAQVYRSATEARLEESEEKHGFAYATVMVTPELSKNLKPGQKLEFVTKQNPTQHRNGIIWKVTDDHLAPLQKAEVILELSDSEAKLQVGDFITAAVSNDANSTQGLTVPHSAVLQASNGAFVFLQNGNYLLRVPVKTGAQNEDSVEITEGLRLGDVVLSKPVEAVYLIELRFVKGGAQAD